MLLRNAVVVVAAVVAVADGDVVAAAGPCKPASKGKSGAKSQKRKKV